MVRMRCFVGNGGNSRILSAFGYAKTNSSGHQRAATTARRCGGRTQVKLSVRTSWFRLFESHVLWFFVNSVNYILICGCVIIFESVRVAFYFKSPISIDKQIKHILSGQHYSMLMHLYSKTVFSCIFICMFFLIFIIVQCILELINYFPFSSPTLHQCSCQNSSEKEQTPIITPHM